MSREIEEDPDLVIEKITPIGDGALRVVVVIPKSNYRVQRLALKALLKSASKDIEEHAKNRPRGKEEAG